MVFFGQVVSNIVTLVLFACALFIVLRHAVHSVQAVGQIVTSGKWGKTPAALLTRRVATSVGIVLAMASGFGLQWWLTMGSVPGTLPRVPHLDEFLNHFLPRFVSGLFGAYPWIWVSGVLGTAVWGLRLLLLVGATAFALLLLRNALDARIRDRSAVWRVPLNVLGGFLAMAMVTYWWPAGMGDRPFFTVVMVILCFMVLGAIGGAMQGNSSPSSARSSSSGWDEPQSRPKKVSDEDEFETGRRKRDDQAREAAKKWQEEERKGWEKRDKDEKQRREDEADKQRRDKDKDDERRREQNRKDAADLAWRLKEEAKKAAWEAEQRRKDDEHRRKQ